MRKNKTVVEAAAEYRQRIKAVASGLTSRKLVLESDNICYVIPLVPGKRVECSGMRMSLVHHDDTRTSIYCYTLGPCEFGLHSHHHDERIVMLDGEMVELTTRECYRAGSDGERERAKTRVMYAAEQPHNPKFTTASRCIIDWMPGLPVLDYEP